MLSHLASLLILLSFLASASAQQPPAKKADPAAAKRIAANRQLLDDLRLQTEPFQEAMPLARFLETLEKLLPPEHKLLFRLDEKAFGKDFPDIAKTPVKLRPYPKKMSLRVVLRLVASKVSPVEIELVIGPTHVTLTTPQAAAYTATHDARDVLLQAKYILPIFQRPFQTAGFQPPFQKAGGEQFSEEGIGWLLRLVAVETGIGKHEWEDLKAVNGAKLVIHTSPSGHNAVEDLLVSLRRLTDLAIVMNARLIEVDRKFYTDGIVPMLAKLKGPEGSPALGPVTVPVWKVLSKDKGHVQGEDLKIKPQEKALFLAHQEVFRYAATPHPLAPDEPGQGTGLTGVTFSVQGVVSADRRGLRLTITQEVAQLVDIRKTKALDRETGKEVEIESPNVRKTATTATIEIADGQPVIMPVDYRLPGQKADCVLILVAEPRIYIEEEEAEIRKGNIPPIPKFGEGEKKPDAPATKPKGKPLPVSKDVDQVLHAVVKDVLTNPVFKSDLALYGTPEAGTFALVDGDLMGWPRAFQPEVAGHELCLPPLKSLFQNRLLGIRLDWLNLQGKTPDALFVQVSLLNVGGVENGNSAGRPTRVIYSVKQEGGQWKVTFEIAMAP